MGIPGRMVCRILMCMWCVGAGMVARARRRRCFAAYPTVGSDKPTGPKYGTRFEFDLAPQCNPGPSTQI